MFEAIDCWSIQFVTWIHCTAFDWLQRGAVDFEKSVECTNLFFVIRLGLNWGLVLLVLYVLVRDVRTGRAAGAAAPLAFYRQGQGGQRCPFILIKGLPSIPYAEVPPTSFKNNTIVCWKSPRHRNHLERRKHDERSSTDVVLERYRSALC